MNPYLVKLFLPREKKLEKGREYCIKLNPTLMDHSGTNISNSLELRFFSSRTDAFSPVIKDAVIVGDNVIKLVFSKEINFSRSNVAESNFAVEYKDPASDKPIKLTPSVSKYIDPVTVVLLFEALGAGHQYTVSFNSMADYASMYSTIYPEAGSTAIVRQGRR